MQSLLKELISKFGFPKLALVMKGTPAAGSPPAVPSTRERVNLRSTRSVDPGSNRGKPALIQQQSFSWESKAYILEDLTA